MDYQGDVGTAPPLRGVWAVQYNIPFTNPANPACSLVNKCNIDRGMFEDRTGGLSIDQITDGTSTTAYVFEVAGRPDYWTRGGANGLVKQTLSCPTTPIDEPGGGCHKPTRGTCWTPGHQTPEQGYANSNLGGCWACYQNKGKCVGGSSFNGLAFPVNPTSTTVVPVCFFNCSNENGANFAFSFHPGSGGACFCDGSAHMLSENINLGIIHNLMTTRA